MGEPSDLLASVRELVDRNLVLIAIASVVYWVALSYVKGETRKFPNGMFKVAGLFDWLVVVHDPKVIDEIRMLPDTVLSSYDAIDEVCGTLFPMLLNWRPTLFSLPEPSSGVHPGKHISKNPYHVPIVRAQLTRALPRLVPGVYEEVVVAFKDFIPPTNDWSSIKVLDTMMKIVARASNRIFVGTPLCRDPDYVNLNVQFTVDVIKAGSILRMFPHTLRPIVNKFISKVPKRIEDGLKHLVPLFMERRKEREEKGADYPEKPLDLLSWLMDEASDKEATDWYLTSRILTVNFAAIHTSSMTFTHALYYLAAYPKYMQPLREEVEEVVKRHGWSKDALDEMHHLDSFIKESQRLCPLAILLMSRILVKDHVFSDGTMVPKGTTIAVATDTTHLSDERYEDPHTFDGFRYVKLKGCHNGPAGTERKYDMVSATIDSLGFGLGRHACPGRFFAVSELKMMLAHAVVTYDMKMADEGVRPEDVWVSAACVPNPTAQVLFRKRA
ncbi:hypothetical protein NLJ89_g2200 [Agrocybe chaxingu]|uniref:Cytochrome P450 n=1 Tax=Agrocybe chaxingu TaxID=84603 RepID=A0A9W8K783_9AGAR|nr:hypothetical protein NLJ89_g2200 [Agrocybe chaxingu]